ncbi:MAG TPA: TonB-dependent receptor [Methylophilaceae bacterium]|nr:TonB-dependent receptor [Methylophilaceae bacterium]
MTKAMLAGGFNTWQLLAATVMAMLYLSVAHAEGGTSDIESGKVLDELPASSEEVVVVGKRASLATAQAIKREKIEIVDSVVADDINKLPDHSVAEAMQRITGVQMAHDRGEGSATQANYSANNARLSPGITIRGLPMIETLFNGREVFTAGGGRTFNFADIPAEMVSAINVYKTSSAEHIEGGLGGLVDLRTRHPFDFAGREVIVKGGVMRGNLADETKPQLSLLASDRWETGIGELGALVNVGYQRRSYREEYTESGTTTLNGQSLPSSWAQTINVGERERFGASIILQWRPADRLELYAEAHHAQFKTIETADQIFVTNTGAASNIMLFPGTADAASVTWAGASVAKISGASRDTIDRNTQVAVGGNWVGDALTLKADLSHTRSYNSLRYSSVFLSNVDALGRPLDNATGFTHNVSNSPSTRRFATSNLTYNTATPLFAFVPFAGELTALQFDAEYQVSGKLLDALSGGLRYADRKADDGTGQLSLTLPTSNPLGTWKIKEITQSAYGMAKLKVDGFPLDGNVGVRVVRTQETQEGFQGTNSTDAEPIDFDRSYLDTLPSVNLRYELSKGLYLRGAASKTITRPDFNRMSPSLTLNAAPVIPIGGAGNPDLRPMRADNYDIALEKYLGKTTSVYLTGFRKNVDGFISNMTNSETHGGIVYQVTRPFNTGASVIRGAELGYQQFYDFLPGWLSGLGLQANYTYVDSDVEDSSLPLAGLSRHSYNIIGIYERGPVSARIAYNWRDKYLTSIVSGIPVYMDAYGWLDASVSYRFTDKISLAIEGTNLLNTVRTSYYGRDTRPQTSWTNDTQVSAVVTVRF